VRELQETLSAVIIARDISSRNSRVAALQKCWDRRRAGLDLILDQRAADMPCEPQPVTSLSERYRVATLWPSAAGASAR
jgi:hypothetical protein